MSAVSIDVAVVTAGVPDVGDSDVRETVPATDRSAGRPSGWWRAWGDRFGLAEVCGTLAAVAGFAAGYVQAGSLLAAAALATVCEAIGFYGCIGAKTVASARRATTHLGGWRRLAAGAWHAVHEQLASCAFAETLDGFLIRPGCLVGAAWLLRPLPGGVWLGFVAGKAAADVAWYGLEASARRGVTWSLSAVKPGARPAKPAKPAMGTKPIRPAKTAKHATPYLALDPARAAARFSELAAALPGVAIHYAVKANPDHRLLTRLQAAGCRFEAASWAEVRAVVKAGADPRSVLYTNPVKPVTDLARAWRAGVWRFAADSDGELRKIAEHAPGAAVLLRLDAGAGGTVGDQGKFGVPPEQVAGLARLAASLGLRPYGLAFHVGSQKMDPAAWDGPIRQCAGIMTELAADGIRLEMLDLGGGFPVRYDADPPPLAEYAADSQDTILDQVWLPEPRAGDQVLIGNAGAYTTCYSGRSAFNGYPAPGVRIVRDGATPRLVRDPEKVLA